jgi:hypothetical protein
MNSSIIIDDIRKRSIRVQRDQILERLRHEEDLYDQPLPKRIIIEAEERAKERVSSSGWKKTFIFILLFLSMGYIVFRFMMISAKEPQHEVPIPRHPRMITTEIQTDSPPNERKSIRFDIDERFEKLKEEYPHDWKEFENDFQEEWLRSPISGPLFIQYYHPELKVAVDVLNGDMLEFPNDYHKTVEQFENFIFEKSLKTKLCEENDIQYRELIIDT